MTSNASSLAAVTSLTLDGVAQLSEHRWIFFFVFFALYVFVLVSDVLVIYVICSQRSLHRPMFVFVAAVLLNSLAGSAAIYPRLLSDLASGLRQVEVAGPVCISQAYVMTSLGSSSFMLLAAMSLDRYVSICRPLRYAALMSRAALAALLLLCFLLPAALVGGAALQAARLPLCRTRLRRLYCDVYSFVSLSCGGGAARLLQVYGLLCSAATVLVPVIFVLVTYGRILFICLRDSRTISSKALQTCVPHLLVLVNYSVSAGVELLQRRLHGGSEPAASILSSVLVIIVPTVCNPLVYGLKVKQILTHLKRLLRIR
ncbi:olfactory receptor 10J5-like [Hippoglossus hippoglossus]|uniref:olfactory receptor 10J5-like n=1 Tax=Hippoglossus hippoglossus TaxID=8267 RepID=UPI00148E0E5F|nr:olfactory receptor 10J5-like [Hippoglossus hippoglossus]